MIFKNREVVIQNMTAKANLFNDDGLTGNWFSSFWEPWLGMAIDFHQTI